MGQPPSQATITATNPRDLLRQRLALEVLTQGSVRNPSDRLLADWAVRKGQQPPWIIPDALWARIGPLLPQAGRRCRHPGRMPAR